MITAATNGIAPAASEPQTKNTNRCFRLKAQKAREANAITQANSTAQYTVSLFVQVEKKYAR